MSNHMENRQKILIVDDSELNRALLAEILENQYDIVEAENGAQAVAVLQEHAAEISLLLLDAMMPEMDGFQVLECMREYHWSDDIGVIMISAETSPSFIERAYDLGASDYISRPFDAAIVRRRVSNTMLLYCKQRRLAEIVTEQVYEKEKSNKLMINILSNIVEFRNGESGLHVLHINIITDMLLKHLVSKTDRYPLTKADIALISTASALHDIGKLSVPDEILNKPGRFTPEEFEIMKGHSAAGAEMLDHLPFKRQDEPLVQTAYEICRWHHERYDGRGYPDGLKGEEIPISAQVVSIADVYDALTSERCYKKAFSHETAMEMILDGQCGVFNPLLLECLKEIAGALKKELTDGFSGGERQDTANIVEQLQDYKLTVSEQMMTQLSFERQRAQFLAEQSSDVVFSYNFSPAIFTMSQSGARLFGLDEVIMNPSEHEDFRACFGEGNFAMLLKRGQETTPGAPTVRLDLELTVNGQAWPCRCVCQSVWFTEDAQKPMGLVGRLIEKGREDSSAMSLHQSLQAMVESRADGKETICVLTGEEAWWMLQYLQAGYDSVRLVDAAANYQMTVDSAGALRQLPYHCYASWEKESRCANCIAAKALSKKSRQSKFEFADGKMYYVSAMPLEVEGRLCALEMISQISSEALMDGSGKEKLVQFIARHNHRLYTDPVTDTYNRLYYEEQLKGLSDYQALVLIDVDDFKGINDRFGHRTGDEALARVAGAICSCMRRSDLVVRYGGDEFVIAFLEIPQDVLERKLEDIRQAVEHIVMEEYPDLKMSVSIGGAVGPGRVVDLLQYADELMYQAKQKKNCVRIACLRPDEKTEGEENC